MRDEEKTQAQLIQELQVLRQRVKAVEAQLEQQPSGASPTHLTDPDCIFQYSGESILIVDPRTLRITGANKAIARRLGYTQQELCTMTLDQIERVPSDETGHAMAWQSTASGTQFYECLHRRKNGSEMPVEVSSRLVQHEGQQVILNFVRDLSRRKAMDQERERLIRELEDALAQVKTLRGLLPICANCKKIRDDQGYWHTVEQYIQEHSDAHFSHGICPECLRTLYPDYVDDSQ